VTEVSEVRWGLTRIPFSIRRSSRRKTVALTIDDGHLVVKAPPGVVAGRLDAVVRVKAQWVVQRLRRAAERHPGPPQREFVGGEGVRSLGRQLQLWIVEAEAAGARTVGGWYEMTGNLGTQGTAAGECGEQKRSHGGAAAGNEEGLDG
jgi:predicted metal-dependent hydrolase